MEHNMETGRQVAGQSGASSAGGASGAAGPSSQPAARGNNNRHSQQQVVALEDYFKNNPHPDHIERNELARTLGLDPAQVKFWFQNKRHLRKTHTEQYENQALRRENSVLRDQIEQRTEALRKSICLDCYVGRTQLSVEGKAMLENIRLKEELERLRSQITSLMGVQNPQNLPIMSQHPLNIPIIPEAENPSTSITSSGEGLNLPNAQIPPNELKKSIAELVVKAAEELKVMALAAEPLWIPDPADGVTSMLNEMEYLTRNPNIFGPTRSGYRCEASRHIAVILLNPKQLINVLMDMNEWAYMFSPVVSRAATIDVLNAGEDYNGTLEVVGAEYHIPTPLVPNREVIFARYCRQHCEGVWAVVDISLDNILNSVGIMTCQKRPSGCLIQEMADGSSKITWVENVYVDYNGVSTMYKRLLLSGLGFGAKRWVSILERQCQRLVTANIPANVPSSHDFNNLFMPTPEWKSGILKISERMVNSFNLGITGPKAGRWTKLPGSLGDDIRLMATRVMNEPGLPTGTLLSISTSFLLPLAPKMVFDFFRDHRSRKEWDIHSNGNDHEPVCLISYGEEASNNVSIYKVPSHGQMLLLQESWSDPVASHVVFAPIEIGHIDVLLSSGDPNALPILPSGFTILPDGTSFHVEGSSGTLLTVSFQVLFDRSPMVDITMGAATEATRLLKHSCRKIKHALGAVGPNT